MKILFFIFSLDSTTSIGLIEGYADQAGFGEENSSDLVDHGLVVLFQPFTEHRQRSRYLEWTSGSDKILVCWKWIGRWRLSSRTLWKSFHECAGHLRCFRCQIDGQSTNLENLFNITSQMQKNGPPGVWLCSTDMVLTCSDVAIDWSCVKDGLLICSICDPHYAANHGAVKVNSDGVVSSILYCGTLQALRDYTLTDGTVLMSLFFDFLVAMAEDVIQDTFVSGHYGHCYDQKFSLEKRTMAQRTQTVVWKELSPCTLKTYVLKGQPSHHYLSQDTIDRRNFDFLVNRTDSDRLLHAVLDVDEQAVDDSALLMNSFVKSDKFCIGSHSVLKNCCLEARELVIGKNCYINGQTVNLNARALIIPENTCIIQYEVFSKMSGASSPFIVTFAMKSTVFAENSLLFIMLKLLQPGQEQDCFKILKFIACKEGSLQRALHLITSTQDQEQLNRLKNCKRVLLTSLWARQDLKGQFCRFWDTFFRVTNAINKRILVEK
ncbi:hypothetical protein MRX96_009111 [Rhipicephalus microplus]